MAIKQFLFQSAEGYADTAGLTDETQLGKITLSGLPDPIVPANGTIGVDMGNSRIVNLADPMTPFDAATKNYVDNVQSGLIVKEPARVMAPGNVTISAPGASIDSVALVAGDRVLLTQQTDPTQNGIYVWNGAASAMTRASDANSSATLKSGTYVFVDEGTANGDSAWVLSTDGTIVVGTTSQAWVQFSGLGQVTAGQGLTKTGNTLDVGAGDGITVMPDLIEIALDTNPGLALNGTSPAKKLAFLPDTARGLDKDSSGAFVKLSTSSPGLYFAATGLDAKLDGSGGLLKDILGIGVKIASINELTKDASGLHVVGVPSLFMIDGVATGATVTAANLDNVTNGTNADAMHTHVAAPSTETLAVKELWTAAGAIAKGHGVYIAANNAVSSGDCTDDTKSRSIGVADAAILDAAQGKIVVSGNISGVLTAATAGTRYFLGTAGEPVLITALPARARTVQLGIAKNTTDLTVRVFDFGKKA
jgi:hypothetical protein